MINHHSVPRILVFGAEGRLGSRLLAMLQQETDYLPIAASRTFIADGEGYERWDTNNTAWIKTLDTERWRPDVIINAAAMTNVDECETNREKAWKSNVTLVEKLAHHANKTGSHLIQVSTDHIFDGTTGPYDEMERPNPINYYGRTKLAAENICLKNSEQNAIVRTMWLYGHPEHPSYPDWVVEQAQSHRELRIADDEYGNPTHIDDLSYAIIRLIETKKGGIWNIAGPEWINRFEWTKKILSEWSLKEQNALTPIKSSTTKRLAVRPLKSGLISSKTTTALALKFVDVQQGTLQYRTNLERSEEL